MRSSSTLVSIALPVFVALGAATCGPDEDPVHPSYDRCVGGDVCGLATRCQPVPFVTASGSASLCTAACTNDTECPGFSARCIAPPDADAGASCYHECLGDGDCREGSACHAVLRRDERLRVCVPFTGARRCRVNADCAPFDDLCVVTDGGVVRDGAAPLGACVLPTRDGG